MISVKTNRRAFCRIVWPSFGMRAAIEVNISTLMPLPTPRSVISSPSHMMTPVPAVMQMTIVASVKMFCLYRIAPWHCGNSCRERASAMKPVDCRIARPMVR